MKEDPKPQLELCVVCGKHWTANRSKECTPCNNERNRLVNVRCEGAAVKVCRVLGMAH